MTRTTHIVDNAIVCGELSGSIITGTLTLSNMTAGACAAIEPPGTTPPGRILRTSVGWRYQQDDKTLVDTTQFAQIHRLGKSYSPTPFPGPNMFVLIYGWPAGGYLAEEFIAPPDTGRMGMISHGETFPGPNIDMCISERPGDFTNANLDIGPGRGAWKWHQPSVVGWGAPLIPGRTYFLNTRLHDPLAIAQVVTLQTNHT